MEAQFIVLREDLVVAVSVIIVEGTVLLVIKWLKIQNILIGVVEVE